ncbi:MAG: DUF11 domain-containing protein [Candidatus Krumholzibacteriia bacterium]
MVRTIVGRGESRSWRRPGWLALALVLVLAGAAQATMTTGTYTGNGNFNRLVGGLGFRPAVVIIKSDGGDSAVIRTDRMPNFYSRHLVERWGLYTNRIHSFDSDGFWLGSDDDVNKNGRTYWYVAFSADPGYLATGTYTGNGGASQTISGLGFAPGLVMLVPHEFQRCSFRTEDMPAGDSVPFSKDIESSGAITGLTADGFTVGNSADANQFGKTFGYVAFAAEGSSVHVGAYTGDGNRDRAIGGVGFEPRWLLIKQAGNKGGVHLTRELSGADETLTFTVDETFHDGIMSLEPDGFVINDKNEVNQDGATFYYAAFADRVIASADLSVSLAIDDPAPELGQVITLTATIANAGPSDVTSGLLQVDLPDGLSEQSFTPDAGVVLDSSTPGRIALAWDIPSGEQRQVAATYRIENGDPSRELAARVASAVDDPVAGNDETTSTLTIATVDVAVTMASSDESPVAGDTVALTVTATNPDPALPVDLVLDHVIPAGMTDALGSLTHGAYDAGLHRWTIVGLPPATIATLVLDVTVGGDQDGNTLTPSVTATSSRNDTDLANNTDAVVHIVGGGMDLQATAAFAPISAGPGDSVDLTLKILNNGPDTATSFSGLVSLPAGLTYVSDVADRGSYDDATGVWTGPALPMAQVATLTITCTVAEIDDSVLQATFTATAPETDPVPGNDTATADLQDVGSFDLAPTVSWSPGAATAGDTVDLQIGVGNQGPGVAVGFAATVAVPAGFVHAGASASAGTYDDATGVWTVPGSLGVPSSETLTITFDTPADASGAQAATVTLAGDPGEIAPGNDAQTDLLTLTPLTDLAAAAGFDVADAWPGDPVVFVVEVTNEGPSTAAPFSGLVTLPAGLTFQSALASDGAFDDASGLWTAASSLPSGATASLAITTLVTDPNPGAVAGSFTVTAADSDPVPGNDTAGDTVDLMGSFDLAVTVAMSPAGVVAGDQADAVVTITDLGPNPAPAPALTVTLPAGLTYAGNGATAGVYDGDTGVWTLPAPLAGGGSETLTLTVDSAGDAATGSYTVGAAVAGHPGDTDAANDLADQDLSLTAVTDLAVAAAFDPTGGGVGDTTDLQIAVTNVGPGPSTGFTAALSLPAGVAYQSHLAGVGAYDDGTGVWTLAAPLASGDTADLAITVLVTDLDAGTLTATATVTAADSDPTPDNDSASASLGVVAVADLALAASLAPDTAWPGIPAVLTLTVTNEGPGTAAAYDVAVVLPAHLDVVRAQADAGGFDAGTGVWSVVADLAAGASASLDLELDPTADADADFPITATVTAAGSTDPVGDNDSAGAVLQLGEPSALAVVCLPMDALERTLLPGGPLVDVLRLRLVNRGGLPAALDSLTVHNPAPGDVDGDLDQDADDQALFDSYWSALRLRAQGLPDADLGGFIDGAATAAGLGLTIAAGDSLDLVLRGAAAVTVPDGVVLQPVIDGAADFGFAGAPSMSGAWPLAAEGTLAVDGMSAAQIILHPVGAEIFQMGSTRNLALDVTVPANGTQPDTMTKLNVVNLGTAAPTTMLTRVEAWADDGDGLFDPAADPRIAELYWTGGQRFEATSLAVQVPTAGQRVFVTVDVAEDALGGTVQFSLPAGDDPAIGMLSGNDGPIDAPVVNPWVQTISSTDKIIVTASTIASRTVAPGASGVPLLTLVARNLYTDTRVLERLRVRNQTTGTGSPGQAALDHTCAQVRLYRDTNDNGVFDGPATDTVVASTTWNAGIAVFDGVNWSLLPDQVATLFVTTTISLSGAADGDLIAAAVGAAADLEFDADVAVVAAWPLQSGARHLVDGMVAAQIACPPVPPVSLTASEGPVLALDLTLPGNGYLGDTLDQLRLQNLGTARAADVASLGLWTDDDGDGVFEPGADTQVASFSGVDASWVALDLALPVPAGGRRLFAGLTVTDTPTDSSTVRLAVPVDGVVMTSTDDGPLDVAVTSPTSLLISTAPLLSTMTFATARSTTAMTVTVTMNVVNVGGEAINAVAPDALILTGDGNLTPVSGPTPGTFDLPEGARGAFTWTYQAETAGTVYATGRCEGVSAVGGQPRGSLATASAPHQVLAPALDLELYPVLNMPFSINRGQAGVVPLTLTLLNEGGPGRAELALRRLVITFDDGDGNPVVPADLLSRVSVGEGINIYGDTVTPETTGQTVTLDLTPEVVVTASEPVTLGLRLDIAADTAVPRFRVSLESAADLTVVDHVSEAPRTVTLSGASFPVRSAAGSIVSQATGLLVTAVPLPDATAGAGQDGVELLRLSLAAEGDDLSSEVKVGSFAVALVDTLGHRLVDAAQRLSRLRVEGPLAVHAERLLDGPADSLVVFNLSPQITVPVGTSGLAVRVLGRVPADPLLGPLSLQLEPSTRFDARDGNVSSSVSVTYEPAAINGPRITLQEPAPTLLVQATGHLPPVLPQGARDALALTVLLTHPGTAGSAPARIDTLRLDCLDADRLPRSPDAMLDGYTLTWDGLDLGAPVIYQGAQLLVPLGGRLLAPATTASLALTLDIEADAPAGGLELVAGPDLLAARDANLDTPLAVVAAAGSTLPASSGLVRIQPATDEVRVAWADRLPAILPIDGQAVEVARLTLVNPSATGAAPAQLNTLVLRVQDRELAELPAGAVLTGASALVDGEPWALVAGLAAGDSTLVLTGAEPLLVAAGSTVELELQVVPRPGGADGGIRFGLRNSDLRCTQTDHTTAVSVRPADGQLMPFWTEAAGLAAADLAASYLNFPNPFAAGRQATRFAFQLPRAGTVTLRVWTPRGEPVITLLDHRELAAGLHQDITWDGLNGRGTVVRNGVFLAELEVAFTDGSRERLLRKVAVVR